MKLPSSFLAFFAAAIISLHAHAGALVVDTGPGSSPWDSGTNNWGLYEKQWLAERFIVSTDTTITSAKGWIALFGQSPQTAHVTIYRDAGEAGPGDALFSQQFSVDPNTFGFNGVTDVQWSVSAGSYIIAFEVLPGDTLAGSMPSPSENPLSLGSYGYYAMEPFESRWYRSIDTKLGVQIEGVAAVPEPTSLALLSIGALVLMRRRNHK